MLCARNIYRSVVEGIQEGDVRYNQKTWYIKLKVDTYVTNKWIWEIFDSIWDEYLSIDGRDTIVWMEGILEMDGIYNWERMGGYI